MFKKAINKLKKWGNKMFNRKVVLEELFDSTISLENYNNMDKWKAIYGGWFKGFKVMDAFTIAQGKHTRPRHQINMAKVITNELAKLTFTERVEVNVGDEDLQEVTDKLLADNRFYKDFRDKVEIALALGGYVIKLNPERKSDGTYKINMLYISPKNFVPLSWDNGEITEAAFLNVKKQGDKIYVLVEKHEWDMRIVLAEGQQVSEYDEKQRVLVISNELYVMEEENFSKGTPLLEQEMKRVPLEVMYEGLEDEVVIANIDTNIFRYLKAPGVNNFDIESPFGISMFANAEDTLLALNIAFDSFIREFQLGKRRVIVPAEAVKSFVDPVTQRYVSYFDTEDEAYVAYKGADPEKQKIVDNTVEIRVEDHLAAINGLLDILSLQVGFSSGTFTFDGKSVKTATEVVSENSKTYQSIKDLSNMLGENIIGLTHAALKLSALYDITELEIPDDLDITMTWDDSVIGDKYTDSTYYSGLVMTGIVSKRYMLRKMLNLTDEQIDKMFEEIRNEQSFAPPVEDLFKTDSMEVL